MFLERCKFKATWRKYQEGVLKEFNKHLRDKKINIVAAPGSGKTTLGLEMVCRLNQHVLILTPTITIKNQWKERFLDAFVPDNMQADFISDDIYNLNKFNIATYQALHYALNKKKIKEDENSTIEAEEEESSSRIKAEAIDYDLIGVLKAQKIKTIVLDEAHHLMAEWWKSLSQVINSIDDIRVISLTATPPYDVDENEWRRYEEVCGTIDAEISVPELVATGDLCPHQDYVIFNKVTPAEESEIQEIRKNIDAFFESLKQNTAFAEILMAYPHIQSWRKYEEQILSDSDWYSSILIYLNAVGKTVDRNLVSVITNGSKLPAFDKKWAEILLKNALYTHKDELVECGDEDVLINIKRDLEVLGCAEKKNVYLNDVNAIKRIMASSIAKMESIEKIVEKEYGALNDNLSMVILADYVRSDYIDYAQDSINKLGVVPIFRRLLAKNICKSMAVLTGKLKIVPKHLVPYIDEQLKLMQISNEGIYTDLAVDSNYVIVKGGKKLETALVRIVTECVNTKKINVIIGTVALLGEGWDAPAVNSLILASYVGSYMLSNQMRGRAIRKSREQNKSANIWHLVSLANLANNEMDFTDLEVLERRFNGFVGIAYYDNIIQNGLERLSIIDRAALKKDHVKLNDEMYAIALDRALMATRWKQILDLFGGINIKMVDKLNGEFNINKSVFIAQDVKNFIKKSIIFNAIVSICTLVCSGEFFTAANFAVELVIAAFYGYKVVRHMNTLTYINQIGKSILNTMVINKKIQSNQTQVRNKVEQLDVNGKKRYKVYLDGASVYENSLYVKSFEEVYSKLVDTRYIICIGGKSNLRGDTYFNVPDMCDNDKNEAEVFGNQWNHNLCKGSLLYTKNKDNRRLFLRARRNGYACDNKFLIRKEAMKKNNDF